MTWSKNLYRHPNRQGAAPSEDYCMQHDIYGLGQVTHLDSHAVTVDFGSKAVRIAHPYPKLHHL